MLFGVRGDAKAMPAVVARKREGWLRKVGEEDGEKQERVEGRGGKQVEGEEDVNGDKEVVVVGRVS